jgi:hypothetical protein
MRKTIEEEKKVSVASISSCVCMAGKEEVRRQIGYYANGLLVKALLLRLATRCKIRVSAGHADDGLI